jgi:voltage-gated potassium channel Kch
VDAAPAVPTSTANQENNTYELFMGVLTLMSLGVMAWLLFAANEDVATILIWMDTLFCAFFLADFGRSLVRAPVKRAYLWPRGIVDLLSSIPAGGALRFLRVFRLARIGRLVHGHSARELAREFVGRRGESAVYVIVVAALGVLLLGSTIIVAIEGRTPDANITSASDAIWWAFVTITTVGYGDRYPVTEGGRLVGVLTMATGIAIFGVVTSFLSSLFLGGGGPSSSESDAEPGDDDAMRTELAALRSEIAALRVALSEDGSRRSKDRTDRKQPG